MKLIASGVTRSAAIIRSPSFSRSSSSTRTTIFPTRMSSIARRTRAMRSELGSTGKAMFPQSLQGQPRRALGRRRSKGGRSLFVFVAGGAEPRRQGAVDDARDVLGHLVAFQVHG